MNEAEGQLCTFSYDRLWRTVKELRGLFLQPISHHIVYRALPWAKSLLLQDQKKGVRPDISWILRKQVASVDKASLRRCTQEPHRASHNLRPKRNEASAQGEAAAFSLQGGSVEDNLHEGEEEGLLSARGS